MKNQKKTAGDYLIYGFLIIGIMAIFAQCGKASTNHSDGKCDICGKTATFSNNKEEYCEKHLHDAVNYYIKQKDN